jgi:phage shock protein A
MFDQDWGRKLARWRRVLERQLAGTEAPKEDPDQLLQQAQEEMRAVHAKNRERAVQAITQKNNLEQMIADTRRKVNALHEKAAEAERQGEYGKAAQYRNEADDYGRTLEMTEMHYREAVELAESVKVAIKAEEERIRQKTAEALMLRAQWKSVQIEQTVARRLAEMNAGVTGTAAEMRAAHEQNREALAEAMRVRDELKQMVEQTARRVAEIKVKAGFARQRGDEELERHLLREMEQHEATLLATRDALDRAEMMTDRAMVLLREEESRLASLPVTSRNGASTNGKASVEGRDPTIPALLIALALMVALIILFFLLV